MAKKAERLLNEVGEAVIKHTLRRLCEVEKELREKKASKRRKCLLSSAINSIE